MQTLNMKVMDLPLLDGMAYFLDLFYDFSNIAFILAGALFLITLCWNAFRLWFGTQQVRKAAVDIMLKIFLFFALFAAYRSITMGLFTTAMKIGSTVGNGPKELSAEFVNLRKDVDKKIAIANNLVKMMFKEAQKKGSGKISDEELKSMAKWSGYTTEDLSKMAKDYGFETYDGLSTTQKNLWNWVVWPGMGNVVESIKAGGTGYRKTNDAIKKYYDNNVKFYNATDAESLNRAKVLAVAMDEIINVNDSTYQNMKKAAEEGNSSDAAIASRYADKYKTTMTTYLFSPFIDMSGGNSKDQLTPEKFKQAGMKDGVIISPGAMLKISVLIANIIRSQFEYTTDDSGMVVLKTSTNLLRGVGDFLIMWIMTIAVIASAIFCMIQYIMCIFEFSITSSIGIIFIPGILFDGTKTYAANLVRLFLSYFFKIIVQLICIFWVFTSYLKVGKQIMVDPQPWSLLNFAYLLFTVILGFVVTQNAPQIASALMNGTPQLSMGEFLHAAGSVAAGAMLAKRHVGAPLAKVAKAGAKGGVRGAVAYGNAMDAGASAAQGVLDGGGTKQEAGQARRMAFSSNLGSAFKSGITNSIAKWSGADVGYRNKGKVSDIAAEFGIDTKADDYETRYSEEQRKVYGLLQKSGNADGTANRDTVRYANQLRHMLRKQNLEKNQVSKIMPTNNGRQSDDTSR